MTLSVIDGDFPRHVIARENLSFSAYNILPHKNRLEVYDSKLNGPSGQKRGLRVSQTDLDRFFMQESQLQHAQVKSTIRNQRRSVLFNSLCFGFLTVVFVGYVCIRIGTPRPKVG